MTTPADDRLRAAAQRALESLTDLIANTTDPGVEALGARYELGQALLNTSPTNLRDRIANALGRFGDVDQHAMADAVMAVLPAPADRPLSPYYEHPTCGFRWHGRDGMDVPLRDGQPVCPRCELRRLADEAQPTETDPEPATAATEEPQP